MTECGAPFTLSLVDMAANKHKDPEYRTAGCNCGGRPLTRQRVTLI